MELVKDTPLTEYCDTQKLSIRDRLQLFTQVCSAAQHGHQKGIIHCDLKPSYILVESHDGKLVPKVIDFGLAKAIVLPSFEPEYAVGLRNIKEGVEAFVLNALSSIWGCGIPLNHPCHFARSRRWAGCISRLHACNNSRFPSFLARCRFILQK
jgi:serine/threonine protein kinase